MSEDINTKKPTRKKLTEEERKARQKEHARKWYLKKKAAEGKGKYAKKKKPGPKKSVRKKEGSGLFLYWKNKKDDMFQEVDSYSPETDAMEIFLQYPKIEEVYLMESTKLYSKPKVVVTDL